ncbi:two-component response regulator [Legionella quinlivanii]|uniref:Two-component response regulator n=1 Tax=Legionella quinlivanii TaxID=45073 RepID=A0A0W0XZ16_9GAMM|nr:response regulator [Legionella quinlivanii]KTD50033.1 two-component response regulator [Legionella quinlivanii]SEF94001.1 Response regulator receiver domain-containing protein [Legionella quinlivanii DSM 21216]STY11191.1 two-component response regulator [Legionella quinlivanii]
MPNKELSSILYAEDEADIREIAQVALEDLGNFKVIFCHDGYEVIEAAKGIIPDLILLDVMMAGMDGPSTLIELRKLPRYTDIPAIFMTAKIQSEEVEQFKSLGAVDVIAKPFDPMTLASDIRAIWDQL